MAITQEKYCFTTVVSDDFLYGFIVMIASLREKNPWFDAPFYVFHHERECPLSEESRAEMRKYYDNIIFHRVDIEKFERILHARDNVIKTPARLASAFFILEAFTFTDYDRVICIDSDMLVLGDVSELVMMKADFAAVPALDHETLQPYGFFNTGLMAIGKEYLGEGMLVEFSEALQAFTYNPRHGAADQVVLNHYFAKRKFTPLAQRYNASKRFFPQPKGCGETAFAMKALARRLQEEDVRILHYIKEKPWQQKIDPDELRFGAVEGFWHEAFDHHASADAKEKLRESLVADTGRVTLALQARAKEMQNRPLHKKVFSYAFPKHSFRRAVLINTIRYWNRAILRDEWLSLIGRKQRKPIKSGEDKGLTPIQVAKRHVLRERYIHSLAFSALKSEFENKFDGQRCFIIGNGPSLKAQDLTVLKDEKVFCTNWFMNHEDYATINPDFYCLSSHEIFGGWNHENIALNEDMEAALLEKTQDATKFYSFSFRDYILDRSPLGAQKNHYLLFDRPKQQVDQKDGINLDVSRMMDDGYTGIITFCIPLAIFMGFKEIYLLGCDCDYGLDGGKKDIQYFYDFSKHKTATTKVDNLRRIWSYPDGAIFKSYRVVKRESDARGVRIVNLTAGGRLEVFPRAELTDVVARREAA